MPLNVLYAKQLVVATLRKASLAQFVQQRLDELGLTYRSAAEKVHEAVSYSTIYNIARQKNEDVGIVTLANLARSLNCSFSELMGAALGVNTDLSPDEERILHLYKSLGDDRRQVLMEMAETWAKRAPERPAEPPNIRQIDYNLAAEEMGDEQTTNIPVFETSEEAMKGKRK